MPRGPGKYGHLADYCRKASNADMALVVIFGGDRGAGFSVQTIDPDVEVRLPAILRDIAQEIENARHDDIYQNPRGKR